MTTPRSTISSGDHISDGANGDHWARVREHGAFVRAMHMAVLARWRHIVKVRVVPVVAAMRMFVLLLVVHAFVPWLSASASQI
jgi:hypothetical protein